MSAPRWRENKGRCPRDLVGTSKRVVVELRNGEVHGKEAISAASPPGWQADGRGCCNWTLSGHSHDIVRFYVLGEA